MILAERSSRGLAGGLSLCALFGVLSPISLAQTPQKPIESLANRQASIKGLVVRGQEDGSNQGLSMDIIVTAKARTGKNAEHEVVLKGMVGSSMRTSAVEALRFVEFVHPKLQKTEFELSFADKYTPKDGGSAGSAFTLLLLSLAEGWSIDPKGAITGDITVDGKIREVGGVGAKVRAAALDGCLVVSIPEPNRAALDDFVFLFPQETLWQVQVFFSSTVDEARATLRTDRAEQLAEAMKQFNLLAEELRKNARYLNTPAAIEQLQKVIELEPRHLSAATLLKQATRTGPRTLSTSSSLEETFTRGGAVLQQVYKMRQARDRLPPNQRGNLLPDLSVAVTDNAGKRLRELNKFVHPDVKPLLTVTLDVQAAADSIAKAYDVVNTPSTTAARRATMQRAMEKGQRDLDTAWVKFEKAMEAIKSDRELVEKLFRGSGV